MECEPWTNHAACADTGPELFYAEPGAAPDQRALDLCDLCAVTDECLAEGEAGLRRIPRKFWPNGEVRGGLVLRPHLRGYVAAERAEAAVAS